MQELKLKEEVVTTPYIKIFIAVSGLILNLPESKIKSSQLQAVNPVMEKAPFLIIWQRFLRKMIKKCFLSTQI